MMRKLISGLVLISVMAAMLLGAFQVSAATESPLDTIPAEDIVIAFTADDFHLPYAEVCGDAVVEDAESSVGKAACLSYDKRAATNDGGLMNSMIRVDNAHNMYIYNKDTGDNIEVGSIGADKLNANAEAGGYAIYKFDDVAMMPEAGNYYIYMFDCWGFQLPLSEENVNALVGQTLDVYISMKVTGNVASTTEGSTPTYYIDRIVFAKSTSVAGGPHDHTYANWEKGVDGHTGYCTVCGESKMEEHVWNEGEVTKEPTTTSYGEKKYNCTICGQVYFEDLDKLVDETPSDTNNTNNNNNNNNAENPAPVNPVIWIALGLLAVAAVVAVIAVIVIKRNKKK